jgi:hypothetical protein
MRFSKKIIMVSPLILAGCLTSENKKADISDYTRAVNNQLEQLKAQQRQQDELNRQSREASRQADERARYNREKASAEETRRMREATENFLRTFREEEGGQKSISQGSVVAPSVAAPQPAEWQPLDGQVVRAGELVMELKKNKGGASPSHAEMLAYLQVQMGLTSFQAEKILDELGI